MKNFLLVLIVIVLCSCQGQQLENESFFQRALVETEESIPLLKITIPFAEFLERWNAISDEITFENQITTFEKVSEYGIAFINPFTQLKVYKKNDYVEKIIVSSTKTNNKENIFTMLSSWMQVILLTNPQLEMKEIDQLFAELGIEPNGDIDQLQTTTFNIGEIAYTVTVDEKTYIFTALLEG